MKEIGEVPKAPQEQSTASSFDFTRSRKAESPDKTVRNRMERYLDATEGKLRERRMEMRRERVGEKDSVERLREKIGKVKENMDSYNNTIQEDASKYTTGIIDGTMPEDEEKKLFTRMENAEKQLEVFREKVHRWEQILDKVEEQGGQWDKDMAGLEPPPIQSLAPEKKQVPLGKRDETLHSLRIELDRRAADIEPLESQMTREDYTLQQLLNHEYASNFES